MARKGRAVVIVLHLRGSAPSWEKANCLGTAPHREPGEEEVYDPWFDELEPDPAMSVCNGDIDGFVCPLRQKCLEFATFNNEKFGVWGGMTEQDRKIMRKIWRWNSRLTGPREEWVWMSHDELQLALNDHLRAGKISQLDLEEEEDDDR